jgi:hypothetical protein
MPLLHLSPDALLALQAAGCDEDLTPEDVDGGDMDELVQQLTDKVIQVGKQPL